MSVYSHWLVFGSLLLVLVPSEVLTAGPVLLPSPLQSHGPVLDVPVGFEEHDEVSRKPGAMESSHESSGFFNEDSEDTKSVQPIKRWETQTENKEGSDADAMSERCLLPKKVGPCRGDFTRWHFNPGANMCMKFTFGGCKENGNNFLSLEECVKACHPDSEYSPSSPEPTSSALPLINTSSLFVPTPEAMKLESETESSGFPLHLSPGLTPSPAADHAHSTDTPPALDLTHQVTGGSDTPLTSEDPFDDESSRTVTQSPTAPEVGLMPSRGPLQPDERHRDDSEEDEETVVFPTEPNEDDDEWRYLTTGPSSYPASDMPPVVFTETSWQGAPPTTTEDEGGAELRHGGTEFLTETELRDSEVSQEAEQVICVDWSNLAGKGYVILTMTDNFDCDEFRMENGDRLLEMLENTFSRKMNIPQGSWLIFLSKPTQQDHQLLMTLASEQEIIAPKEVVSMLGEIRRGLYEIGIQNYSTVNTCHSRPSQTRSDYGKLFVVLVIIGSICVLIIASGIIYICWQRRLPKLKNMSRGEELHFVENGCHDNPTLDVTSDNQLETQEKKHSANGVTAGGEAGSGWQVLVNKPGKEEEDNQEEDTHL
ncbi:podocalyxin-like protein 2 [Triplophysa rosa]|uniref:Podocalyxin-like protein 2 n=1 Tax=Triplophysa rosa TaxID=992332 RepID=A0A9W7T6V8_TRIRA|nr:podocalyxin-like protein 2 [Triplophysa rosa]KAI7791151.1 putative podocalyxin-like protein 2 [Triplophysa rosa]